MPKFRVKQSELGTDKYLGWWFDTPADQLFLEKVVKAAGIETRYWAIDPKEYFSRESGLFLGGRKNRFVGHTERQALLKREALKLCVPIAKELLGKVGAKPDDVGLVSFNSTTMAPNPDIPALVASRLKMPHSVRRTQIIQMGCYGSAPNLVRCAEALESGRYEGYAMMLVCELCSLTFQPHTRGDRGYQIAAIIFADAAGGMLLRNNGRGPRVLDFQSFTDYETFPEMSFEVEDEGQRFVLSKEVPRIVGEKIREPVDELLARNGLEISKIDHFLIHPGGTAIIREGYKALGLDLEKDGAVSLEINRKYGNTSSASMCLALKEFMDSGKWKRGQYCVWCSMGPGITIETVLFRMGWS